MHKEHRRELIPLAPNGEVKREKVISKRTQPKSRNGMSPSFGVGISIAPHGL